MPTNSLVIMRSQLVVVHLAVLCIFPSLAGRLVAANEGADNDRSSEFERVFGEKSEPLEPEEASRLIAHQYELYRKQAAPDDPVERETFQTQFKLLRSLMHFERVSADCNRDVFVLVDEVARRIDELPALKAYLHDRRDHRLLESCDKVILKNLQVYKAASVLLNDYGMDESVTVRSALESLSQVPAEVVLGENWFETKSEQVSAALYAIMRLQLPYFKPASFKGSGSDFRQLFESTVEKVCAILPYWPEIIPDYMEEYFIRERKLEQLDSTALNWHKLDRMCESIRKQPDLASDIVSEYKDKLEKEKDPKEQERCKDQNGCIVL